MDGDSFCAEMSRLAHATGQCLALSKIFSFIWLSKRTEMTDKQFTSDQVERLVNTGL